MRPNREEIRKKREARRRNKAIKLVAKQKHYHDSMEKQKRFLEKVPEYQAIYYLNLKKIFNLNIDQQNFLINNWSRKDFNQKLKAQQWYDEKIAPQSYRKNGLKQELDQLNIHFKEICKDV